MRGPNITIPIRRLRAEPLKSGPISSFIIPNTPKMITINTEGTRLISPVRRTYLRIEMRLSNSKESNQCCFFSSPVIFCSGSNYHLPNCSVQYIICPINTIIKDTLSHKLKVEFSFKIHSQQTHTPFTYQDAALLGLKNPIILFSLDISTARLYLSNSKFCC